MLYFVIDGIESNLAGIFTVSQIIVSNQEQVMSVMDKILVILTCCLTLMTNTPYHTLKWAFFGMVSCLGTSVYTWLYSE